MTIRSIQKCFSVLCLGCLWLLAATAIVQQATERAEKNFNVAREKHDPAPAPSFSELPTRRWGKAVDAFFNDRFPCRKTWIKNYRSIFVKALGSPYAERVQGKDTYEFYTGEILELETYMGVCTLPDSEIDNWRTIIEGRKAWADAMGIWYFQVIIPYRAFIDEEFLPVRLRRQKRESLGKRLFKSVQEGQAASRLLYPAEEFRQAEKASGCSCYYKNDAHFSPNGMLVIYRIINAKIREAFPSVHQVSLDDAVPPKCAICGKELAVSYPGEINVNDDYYLTIRDTGHPYPEKNVMTRRPGPGLRVLLSNDSMLRLSLDSWTKEEGHVHLPFGKGVKEVKSFMWKTLKPDLLESIVTDYIPDVWIEEMLEGQLKLLKFGAPESLRNSAAFGRAVPINGHEVPDQAGDDLHLLAVLEGPKSRLASEDATELLPMHVRFFIGHECAYEATTYQGIRRAVFSKPIRILPRYVGLPIRVEIDGEAKELKLSCRISGKSQPVCQSDAR